MRKASAARFLVDGPDVVPKIDRYSRQPMGLNQEDFHAIGQLMLLHGQLRDCRIGGIAASPPIW